jgi:hypothetical protein
MCVFLLTLGASAETKTVFTDVPSTAWYAGNVAYVYENGLMNGTSATTFEPSASLTRAMFVTILGRLDGVDTSAYGSTSFADVATGQWYSAYVAWASENGIVNGYSATTFGTNDLVTREQMATIIARYVDYAGVTLPQAESIVASFQDASSVSGWAREGLELMRTTGIITGYTDGTFGPKRTAMRMEAATVFTRLDQAIDRAKGQNPSNPDTPNGGSNLNQNTTPAKIVNSGTCGDNLTWTLDERGTLRISGTGNIPDFARFWSTDIAPWCYLEFTSVVIETGITGIGEYAFDCCSALSTITIPNSVTGIGKGAFIGNGLTSVTIPNSVTSIGNSAFYNCTGLTSISIPDSVTSIGDSAFSWCSSLTSISIPNSVTSIGEGTFYGCTSLTSITIPDRVTSIGASAFEDCTSLTAVVIPASVTSIGDSAFEYASNLTDIYYSGNADQWSAIAIGSRNTPLDSATIHYNAAP